MSRVTHLMNYKIFVSFFILLFLYLPIISEEIWLIDKPVVNGYPPKRAVILRKLVAQELKLQAGITAKLNDTLTLNDPIVRRYTLGKNGSSIGVSSEILVMDSIMYIFLDKWSKSGVSIYTRQLKVELGKDVKKVVSYIAESLLNKNRDTDSEIPGLSLSKNKINVAIIGFNSASISRNEAFTLTDWLISELVIQNEYNVIERAQMEEILKEQGFQQSGCVSSECAIDAGQLLGVQQMITGNIGKLNNIYRIDLRMIDVATGKITKQADTEIHGSIIEVAKYGIPRLAKILSGKKVEEKEVIQQYHKKYTMNSDPECDIGIELYPDSAKILMNDSLIGIGEVDIEVFPGNYKFTCQYKDSIISFYRQITEDNDLDTSFIMAQPFHFTSAVSVFFMPINYKNSYGICTNIGFEFFKNNIEFQIMKDFGGDNSQVVGGSAVYRRDLVEHINFRLSIGGQIGFYEGPLEPVDEDGYPAEEDRKRDKYIMGPVMRIELGRRPIFAFVNFSPFLPVDPVLSFTFGLSLHL